jgi:hypothetical protein
MSLVNEINRIAAENSADLKESKGAYTLECIVAERKGFLSRKKLVYRARFIIEEENKELRFTEMLKESGWGLSSGDADLSPGFGFKKETYKQGLGPKEGTIEEQSRMFGEKYQYKFELGKIRKAIEEQAKILGYKFSYHITELSL